MVIPLKIIRQGYTEDFCYLYKVSALRIDLYGVKIAFGSSKRNGQFFTLVFVDLEPVNRCLLRQIIDMFLDLAIVVQKYSLREGSIIYVLPQGNTTYR